MTQSDVTAQRMILEMRAKISKQLFGITADPNASEITVQDLIEENQDLRDRLEFVLQGKEIHETAFRYWKLKR